MVTLLQQVLPDHETHDIPWYENCCYFEPAVLYSEYVEQKAKKGHSAFVQVVWTEYANPKIEDL
ncbi:hypothetical protein TNCT_106801, partial [Trichonephila clavata]